MLAIPTCINILDGRPYDISNKKMVLLFPNRLYSVLGFPYFLHHVYTAAHNALKHAWLTIGQMFLSL